MQRWFNWLLALASAALFLAYGAAFVARWGIRGLIGAAIFGAVLAVAAMAGAGLFEGRGPRRIAALGYALLAGVAAVFLLDAVKNDIIRDLLLLQAATGVIGLLVCLLPRNEW